MYIVDTLLRAFLQDNDSQEEKSVDDQIRIHTIITDYPDSTEKLTDIRKLLKKIQYFRESKNILVPVTNGQYTKVAVLPIFFLIG